MLARSPSCKGVSLCTRWPSQYKALEITAIDHQKNAILKQLRTHLEMHLKRQWTPALPLVLALSVFVLTGLSPVEAAGDLTTGTVSGLVLPRFVSLKADRVNVRRGPNKDNEVAWVYTRAGLPVEITAEYENWRRIRDWEGAEGWVYQSLLSGRRTALVSPQVKTADELVAIYERADARSNVVARLQSGVLATVKRCSGTWCRIAGDGFDGWIEQERLWGVYPNETME
jgi:SH3-like domain-containing protein